MYKVMIVDDEPVIRKGLLSFVNWEALDCKVIYEASNGIEAKDIVDSNYIDILITDIKMPGMDGLELSKYVYENYPKIKVIVLTAYADFTYAQSSIKYDIVDYIIKTNPSDKIPEAVNKAKALIVQSKEKEDKLKLMEEVISGNLSEIREKLIKDILNGIIINPVVIKKQLEENKIALSQYFAITFEINNMLEEYTVVSTEEHNNFLFSIKNFLTITFKDYQQFTLIMSKNSLLTLVSLAGSNPLVCTQSLLITCSEILEFADSFMKFTLSIGISGMHTSPFELPQAYIEAQDALLGNFYSDNHVAIYTSKKSAHNDNTPIEAHKYTDKIISDLQQGNADDAISSLSELFDQYRDKVISVEQVKVSSMLLCSLCYRLLSNFKLIVPEFEDGETEIYKQIQESKSIQTLSNILTRVIRTISGIIVSNEKQYNYLVKNVNKYIMDNYNKDINLQSIADYLYVNSSYLSRLYKKNTGELIIDTLNKFRIEKAKALLLEPGKKIFEVALEIGIEDPAYFTRVFTKYVGISPKEYKAQF